MRSTFAVLATLPFVAMAHLEHGHHHVHGEVHGRALITETVVVTETIYTTLTVAPSSSAMKTLSPSSTVNFSSNGATSITSPTALPSVAPPGKPPKPTNNPYAALLPEPNNAMIVNSCDYDVYVSSIGDESCGPGTTCHLIGANSTYTEPIRTCYKSGISLKVSKTKDIAQPVQFEYTVWDNKKTVSYDISYLDCMMQRDGNKDFSRCAGHERGIQAAAGEECPVFHCLADVECAQHAYTVPEFGYMPGAPVGACEVDKGIAFELCAENRA